MESPLPRRDSAVVYLIWTVLAVAIGILFPKLRRYAKIWVLKKQYGCEEPVKYRHEDKVMGSDMVRERANAMKEGRFFKLYGAQFEEYGKTFEEIWRGKPLINTIEPANVQRVAATAFEDFGKDPERAMAEKPLFGPSIFTDGPIWKHARAIVKPIFSRAEISDIDHFESYCNRFMALIPDDGGMIDVQPLLDRLFLNVSMDFLFGKSLGFLQPDVPPEATEFIEAFVFAQSYSIKRRESGWLDFHLFHYKNDDKEFKKAYTIVHKFVDEQVARALRENSLNNESTTSDDPPVRRRYVLVDEMAKQVRDPVQLRYHVLAVFLPARESSAKTLGNILFQLARHPHVWTQLRQRSLEAQEPLTFEKLKSLVEFRYVLHETIRTIGAARVWRMAVKDTILPVGGGPDQKSPIFVARGTPVVSVTWAMNKDKDTWGDDVEEFKPERWIGRKPLWEFVPFWGGPRICPAQQQVLTHVVYLLVRLTQRFERIENCDSVIEYKDKITSAVGSLSGVKVAFKSG